MKLSLGTVTAMGLEESLQLAKTAEKSGFHRIYVGEDIFHREVFTYLSIIALNTGKIGLATGITSPYIRNRYVLANSAKALSEMCKGRFILGLGVGGLPEIKRLTGNPPKHPLEHLEEAVRFQRERLESPVYLGVRGPKMLRLSGRISDGVILSGPPGYIEEAIRIIDSSGGRRKVKKVLWNAFYLGENPELVSKITSVMLDSMPEFAKRHLDPERRGEELCISGEKEEVLQDIKRFRDMGVDEFVVGPPYGEDPKEAVKTMGGLNSAWNSV